MAAAAHTIYIAGAGIAGLTLALALAKFNIRIVVLERTNTLETEGAGLQISPNARRVLDHLGMSDALGKTGFAPHGIDIYPFRRPTPLITLEMGDAAQQKFGAPYCVFHRADLAQALFDTCKRFANIDIQFGTRNFDLITHARGLSLYVEEANGGSHDARPHAFVGADGVNSPTRTRILGGPEAKYSGFCAWRTMIARKNLQSVINLKNTSVFWAPGFHLVAYPIPVRDQVNVVLATREKPGDPGKTTSLKTPTLPKMLLKSEKIEAILNAANNNWTMWPLNAVSTNQWYQGPVGLIGDAAHAMLPFQAQGAAMAIEDAAILAPLLAADITTEAAFARYELLRRKRVERMVNISARNGSIYHMEWPFTLARDAIISAQGPSAQFKRLDWIYNYDPLIATKNSAFE